MGCHKKEEAPSQNGPMMGLLCVGLAFAALILAVLLLTRGCCPDTAPAAKAEPIIIYKDKIVEKIVQVPGKDHIIKEDVLVPVFLPVPAPYERTVYKDRIVEKTVVKERIVRVEVPGPERIIEKIVYVEPCPPPRSKALFRR